MIVIVKKHYLAVCVELWITFLIVFFDAIDNLKLALDNSASNKCYLLMKTVTRSHARQMQEIEVSGRVNILFIVQKVVSFMNVSTE